MQFPRVLIASVIAVPLAFGGTDAPADKLAGVPSANPKAAGVTVPTILSPDLAQVVSAQGSTPVENPTALLKYYGYLNDQPNLLPALGSNVEASETEPTVAGARLPNSFVYRFTPKNRFDLTEGGRLQALQVKSKATGQPIVFQTASALTQDIKDLHTYGNVFSTGWVTVHDTDADGFAAFNANALAKARGATPFKRPENGQFRPGSSFREFYFDETGDTSASTTAAPDHGGFGGVLKLVQSSPSATTGKLTLFFRGDLAHTGLDNCSFWDEDHIVFVEDAGDTLHGQRNALDSGWLFDVHADYSNPASKPVRIIAEGRDPSATIDSGLQGTPGFQNEGDNEITARSGRAMTTTMMATVPAITDS